MDGLHVTKTEEVIDEEGEVDPAEYEEVPPEEQGEEYIDENGQQMVYEPYNGAEFEEDPEMYAEPTPVVTTETQYVDEYGNPVDADGQPVQVQYVDENGYPVEVAEGDEQYIQVGEYEYY